jgi:hypothetical protein
MKIKCIVPAFNASGEPDFFFCIVECTEEQYNDGQHYKVAREEADSEGYEEVGLVYDERDSGGKAILNCFEWESATVVKS